VFRCKTPSSGSTHLSFAILRFIRSKGKRIPSALKGPDSILFNVYQLKRPRREADHSFHPVLRLRISGAMSPLHIKISARAHKLLYLYLNPYPRGTVLTSLRNEYFNLNRVGRSCYNRFHALKVPLTY
jgi:hypothetical protein